MGSSVTVEIDAGITYQTMAGFGATTMALANTYSGLPYDTLGPLRERVIEAAYGQVGLNAGNIDSTVSEPANDDDDPFHFEWTGFDTSRADLAKRLLIDLAEPHGFTDYYFGKLNTRWVNPWLDELKRTDYDRFLDECAEQLVAPMVYLRDQYAIVPRFLMPFNEPLSGNRELAEGTPRDVANIIKRTGARLRREGFDDVMMVAPNEETEEQSLVTATEVLSDAEARQYVGAIGYHPYPYGSIYASVPRILSTSGQGKPDADRVKVRRQLRDLGRKYSIPLWMTEVSHPEVDPRSFDHLRGRAIHIHDELVYADAAAYYAMNNMWDLVTHRDHFDNDDLLSEADTVALANNETGQVFITGIGYAIGHYARWIEPGALRIAAHAQTPLLQVTAFWDKRKQQLVLVAINNAPDQTEIDVLLQGVVLMGKLVGEQSTGAAPYPASYWQSIAPWDPPTPTSFGMILPAHSVTSIAGQARGALPL